MCTSHQTNCLRCSSKMIEKMHTIALFRLTRRERCERDVHNRLHLPNETEKPANRARGFGIPLVARPRARRCRMRGGVCRRALAGKEEDAARRMSAAATHPPRAGSCPPQAAARTRALPKKKRPWGRSPGALQATKSARGPLCRGKATQPSSRPWPPRRQTPQQPLQPSRRSRQPQQRPPRRRRRRQPQRPPRPQP